VQVSPQVLGIVAVLLLGFFSITVRWFGDMSLQYTGSDLSFSAASLHLGFVFQELQLGQHSELDILIVLIFLILWTISLGLAKRADVRNLGLTNISLYSTGSLFIGALSVIAEVLLRSS
jgi:hypothetical protein